MPNAVSTTVGLLINNPNPLPDGDIENIQPASLAATGTTQTDAAVIAAPISTITNNTAANGVILPVGIAGQRVYLIPALITNAPKVYPPVGGAINFGTANASVAITARKLACFIALDSTGLSWGLLQSA